MVLNNILETIIKFMLLPRRLVLALIRWYQFNFSHDHSVRGKERYPFGYCRFNPTCSEYAYKAVAKYGVIYGGFKAIWRVLRCNPWSKGGHDPL
jgi:uncharacterized protein